MITGVWSSSGFSQIEFDEELWGGLLDHICVKEDEQMAVVFKGGIEVVSEG